MIIRLLHRVVSLLGEGVRYVMFCVGALPDSSNPKTKFGIARFDDRLPTPTPQIPKPNSALQDLTTGYYIQHTQ